MPPARCCIVRWSEDLVFETMPSNMKCSAAGDFPVAIGFGYRIFERVSSFNKNVTRMTWTAVYKRVAEGYVAFVEELPGANTQGSTLEETRENLKEAVALIVETNRMLSQAELAGEDVFRERFELPEAA